MPCDKALDFEPYSPYFESSVDGLSQTQKLTVSFYCLDIFYQALNIITTPTNLKRFSKNLLNFDI